MGTVIRTGIASFGMSGKVFHAPFLRNHPGFELVAIVERHKNESRELYPETKLLRSFEELLADDTIELVVVNTPVQTHFEYVKAALEAGKKVVVEKPFTVTAEEARELEALVKAKNGFLSVYQNRRYDADAAAVREVVQSGLLGEMKEVEIRYDRFRPGYSGKEHKEAAIPGSGVLHDLGAHLIDLAITLFGMPEKIFGDLRVVRGGESKANDYVEVLMYYTGLRVRIKSTVIGRADYPSFILNGTKGSFTQERSDTQEAELLAGKMPSQDDWAPAPPKPDGFLHVDTDGKELKEHRTSRPGNFMKYYDGIYAALTGAAANPVPASDAVKTMTVIDAAIRSNDTGTVVTL
ncbi:MAG: oxidoreductase [Chitinophagaceae bacterium]|nr:MAG: oxidoreductase [Chitinophagaceae bacterium]